MDKLGSDGGCLSLACPLWAASCCRTRAIPDLVGCELTNHDLLEAVRSLAFTVRGPDTPHR